MMNGAYKTEAAVFSHAMLPESFPFHQFCSMVNIHCIEIQLHKK